MCYNKELRIEHQTLAKFLRFHLTIRKSANNAPCSSRIVFSVKRQIHSLKLSRSFIILENEFNEMITGGVLVNKEVGLASAHL